MKKAVSIFVILLLCLGLISCKKNPTDDPSNEDEIKPREDTVAIEELLETHGKFSALFSNSWIWDVSEVYELSNEFGVLNFSRDGSVSYEIGDLKKLDYRRYIGKYEVSLRENSLEKPVILYLDLDLDLTYSQEEIEPEIHARYFADISGSKNLELWNASGEPLYANEEESFTITYYNFWQGDSPFSKY